MRVFIAWLLLTIATFQWFGSYFSFQLRRTVIIEYQMNFLENSVAKKLENETGLVLSLKTTSPEYIEIMGYDNKFIVTQEVEGQNIQFIIDDSHKQVLNLIEKPPHDKREHNRDIAMFKLILSDFIKQPLITVPPITSTILGYAGYFPVLECTFFHSIPTPPPEVV